MQVCSILKIFIRAKQETALMFKYLAIVDLMSKSVQYFISGT